MQFDVLRAATDMLCERLPLTPWAAVWAAASGCDTSPLQAILGLAHRDPAAAATPAAGRPGPISKFSPGDGGAATPCSAFPSRGNTQQHGGSEVPDADEGGVSGAGESVGGGNAVVLHLRRPQVVQLLLSWAWDAGAGCFRPTKRTLVRRRRVSPCCCDNVPASR